MLNEIDGNIFCSALTTIVNTVNCEGIMGAGLALECRLRYPEMFKRYQTFCQQGQLQPGKLWLYKNTDRWVLNFPTKNLWRQPSQHSYIESGLQKFAVSWQKLGINGAAFPMLGTDRGGLQEQVVLPLMKHYLTPIAEQIPIEIYRYQASAKDDLFAVLHDRLAKSEPQQIAAETGIQRQRVERLVEAVISGQVCQLNQLVQIEGIGLITLEKVFHYCMTKTEPSQASLF